MMESEGEEMEESNKSGSCDIFQCEFDEMRSGRGGKRRVEPENEEEIDQLLVRNQRMKHRSVPTGSTDL